MAGVSWEAVVLARHKVLQGWGWGRREFSAVLVDALGKRGQIKGLQGSKGKVGMGVHPSRPGGPGMLGVLPVS